MKFIPHGAARYALAASIVFTGVTGWAATSEDLKLTGAQEVPPVVTSGSGSGSFTVADDGAVSGSVKTTDVAGTVAHIHTGVAGVNGPPIITLVKTADGVWSAPPGAKLTADQVKAFKAGGLYVNVHTEANKDGEVRTQLAP